MKGNKKPLTQALYRSKIPPTKAIELERKSKKQKITICMDKECNMKHRMKWMLLGLGFTFGIQAVISLIANLLFGKAQTPQGILLVLIFGLTLGTFLIGGFVIGLMSEKIHFLDSTVVALATILLSALLFILVSSAGSYYLAMNWLNDSTGRVSITGQNFLYIVLALVAAMAGNYLGWRVQAPQEGQFDRIALLIGLMGAVIGPFVMFSFEGSDAASANEQHFPWYFLVLVILLVLVSMGVGFLMFTRESCR
jgi:MFS family permease